MYSAIRCCCWSSSTGWWWWRQNQLQDVENIFFMLSRTNRGYQFQDSILIIIIRGRVPQLWHTPRGSLFDDVTVMSWTKTWLGADSDLLFWKLNLEGKSEEKAGMSVGLRERERERRSLCDDRERERRAKEEEKESKRSRGERAASGQIQLSTFKFQLSSSNNPFRFWGFFWKKGIHPCFPCPWAGVQDFLFFININI